jgi:hypothetical protein
LAFIYDGQAIRVGATQYFYIYNTIFLCDNTIMAKQKLSPSALKAKRARDLAAAKSPLRKKRKRENQKKRRGISSFKLKGKDVHHTPDGRLVLVSVKNNRGNYGKETKSEG